jgi:hypothetical protein
MQRAGFNQHLFKLQIAKFLIYLINYFKPANQRFGGDSIMHNAFNLPDSQHDV